jgi:urease accessory protein
MVIWQLIDSGFPSGGFAHSGGLEASVHHGLVTDAAGVAAFASQALAQAGRSALPWAAAAYDAPAELPALDRQADLFLNNPVANRASRAQGRALLTSIARSFPSTAVSSLESRIRDGHLACHYAPMFGVIFRALDIERTEAGRALLFTTVRAITSSAVRLGLLGAFEAQALQARLAPAIESTLERCTGLTPDDVAQTAPLIDLCQATHDRLYSRLFQS